MKNSDLPAMPFTQEPFPVGAVSQFLGPMASGLTKREMFSMAAMQGLLASLTDDDNISPSELARCSVLNADALLAELERTK